MNPHQNKKYSLKSLFRGSRGIYRKMPPSFRRVFIPLKWFLSLIRGIRFDLWIITGKEIKSKQELSIFYAGSKENRNYIINLIFDKPYKENYIGKMWIWGVLKKIKEKILNCSLMVVEAPGYFSLFSITREWFYICRSGFPER